MTTPAPLRALLAAVALAAAAPAASAQVFQEQLDLPSVNLAFFGLVYTADYLGAPAGTIVDSTLELTYTTGTLDAADLRLSLQAPSEGLPFWTVTGADLGWSGSGTFHATVSSDVLDGPIDLGDPAPDFSLYGLTITAVGGQLLSGQLQASFYEIDVDRWIDLGKALPGTGGVAPALDPTATLAPNSPMILDVSGAQPGAPTFLALGAAKQDLPFLGGVLVPDPLAVVPLAADASGAASLQLLWPAGVPKGISLYAQAWTADAGAPQGFAATNAVKSVTP